MTAEQAMADKHHFQMEAHIKNYGPLGELRVKPTKEHLDKDFKDRRAKGELFTQKKEKQ